MNSCILKIKEEDGCELYNMYKVDTVAPYNEKFLIHISGDESVYIDFENKIITINGVRIYG